MTAKLIKHGHVIDDLWTFVDVGLPVAPDGAVIVPIATWIASRDAFAQRADPIGVWLAGDAPFDALIADLDRIDLVALRLPKFADGRAFSAGALLRERHRFAGELRAIGEFLPDQVRELQACGFDAFVVDALRVAAAIRSLSDFSVSYQASATQPEPLFRRRHAA